MSQFGKAVVAGFIATFVLSALMVMKTMMGIMPTLDLPGMIAGMMGMPGAPAVGWLVHFMIGSLGYGAALALLDRRLPGDSRIAHGMVLASAGWLMMMILLMPMAGAGFFGLALGWPAPVMTLMLHLVFGAVLGWYFGRAVSHEQQDCLSHA